MRRKLLLLATGWLVLVAVVFCRDSSVLAQDADAQDADAQVTDSNGQTYRLIRASHFEMGSEEWAVFRKDHTGFNDQDDRPRHPVILSRPYYMATTEVTVGQFRKFVEATGYETTAEKGRKFEGENQSDRKETVKGIVGWEPVNNERGEVKTSFRADPSFSWKQPGFSQDDSHPVTGVSYFDAKAYCEWLSEQDNATYRLPTEAEWECACRAGTTTHFSFDDEYRGVIHQHANIANVELEKESPGRVMLQWLIDVEKDSGDGFAFTAPVGTYQANPWGLHDMHGNVWEWCEDHYLDTFYDRFTRAGHGQIRKRAIDPLCTEKWNEHGQWQVIRGGSWFVSPLQSRSGTRSVFNASDAACYVGFRVVRDAPREMIAASESAHRKSEEALQWLSGMAKEAREYHDGAIKLEIRCDDLSEGVFSRLAELHYAIDLTVRPPGQIDSETIAKFAPIRKLFGFGIAVNCSDVSAETYAMLAGHPELKWLQITGSGDVSDKHLFPYLRSADGLSSIMLQGEGITDAGLTQLPALKNLRSLHVSSTSCTGESISRFAGSPLEEASFGKLTDQGTAELAKFQGMRNLNCQYSPITQRGFDSIASLRRLSALNLSHCDQLKDDDLTPLGMLQHLRQLNLEGTDAGDATLRALSNSVSLEDLRLGSEKLSDAGLADLCQIVSLRDVTICKEASNISDQGLADFWRLANLQNLSIFAPKITGEGFAPLTELPKLRQLTLHCPKLSDAACEHIARIEPLTNLSIGGWNIDRPASFSDAGLLKLAESPNLKKLTIHRQGTEISDTGLQKLKELRGDVQLDLH